MRIQNLAIVLMFWMVLAGSAFAEPQGGLSKAGHKAFDDLINGKASVEIRDSGLANEICGETTPCVAKLSAVHEAFNARYKKDNGDSCAAPFRYDFREIDCGLDGAPDLWVQYRGACIYDYSEAEESGNHVVITRDKDGAYLLVQSIDYWERNTFEFYEKAYYKRHGACGATCFSDEIGFMGDACQMKQLYLLDYDVVDEDEAFHIGSPEIGIELVEISILGNKYYRFFGDINDKAEKELIENGRKAVTVLNPLLPKVFKMDETIFDKILTSKALDREIDAAKASCKPQVVANHIYTVPDPGHLIYCCECGRVKKGPCNPVVCAYPHEKQAEVDKKFKKWKRTHCSPLPDHSTYRRVCEMAQLDLRTSEGRHGWIVLKSDEYCVTHKYKSIFKTGGNV